MCVIGPFVCVLYRYVHIRWVCMLISYIIGAPFAIGGILFFIGGIFAIFTFNLYLIVFVVVFLLLLLCLLFEIIANDLVENYSYYYLIFAKKK